MNKKLVWALVALLTLGVITAIVLVSLNVAESNRIKHEQQIAAQEAQRLIDRDNEFLKKVRLIDRLESDFPPEYDLVATILKTGKDTCDSVSEGRNIGDVAYEIHENFPGGLSSQGSAEIVSYSIDTYCTDIAKPSLDELEDHVYQKISDAVTAKYDAIEKQYIKNAKDSGLYKDISKQIDLFAKKGENWSIEQASDICFRVDGSYSVGTTISSFESQHDLSHSDAIGAVAVSIKHACPEKYDFVNAWQLDSWG